MATPLYKAMKERGTSFYAFPSAAEDINQAHNNQNFKVNFTKFVCLNFPNQSGDTLNFDITTNKKGDFFCYEPSPPALSFGDNLIESLRNYVANYDDVERESRINSNTDFYNISELQTPTEMIFWKWCRKLNLMDFEPGVHLVDWDKNLPDFQNPNASTVTNTDYFREYLWKEREINYYSCVVDSSTGYYSGGTISVEISSVAKFKIGDEVNFSGTTNIYLVDTTYTIENVTVVGSITYLDLGSTVHSIISESATIYLDYTKFIQYVGDTQVDSQVQTSRRNYNEIIAKIPHHEGQTPNILFKIEDNNNYYPNLELPIIPEEIQDEIMGAESLNSPIRLNPSDYPGSYFGYFDTDDKTYICSSGDKLRKKGNYYGIELTNNVDLDQSDYVESLVSFNSDDIDGLTIDFETEHYYKMTIANLETFNEFNSYSYNNEAPSDFYFNAILWYYEIDDGSGNITTNLYGVEFLNNPNNDLDGAVDPDGTLIRPYPKYVSNGVQDGVSYDFILNINYDIDNDVLPMSYDPTSIYNSFSLDLYKRILQTNAQMSDNYMKVLSGYTYFHEELWNIKSLIYSQTDLDLIKSQIINLEELLTLYSTYQFVDSPSIKIETDYTGNYPTLRMRALNSEYSEIYDITSTEIYNYNQTASGTSYPIIIPTTNQVKLTVDNDDIVDFGGELYIMLTKDLEYAQAMDITIDANMTSVLNKLNVNMNFYDGDSNSEIRLFSVNLPVDLYEYNSSNPTGSTYANSYYNHTNVNERLITFVSGSTSSLYLEPYKYPIFQSGDTVYVDNFYFNSGDTVVDLTGVYTIQSTGMTGTTYYYNINLDSTSSGLTMKNYSDMNYYKGMNIRILRVDESNTSTVSERYEITRKLL